MDEIWKITEPSQHTMHLIKKEVNKHIEENQNCNPENECNE